MLYNFSLCGLSQTASWLYLFQATSPKESPLLIYRDLLTSAQAVKEHKVPLRSVGVYIFMFKTAQPHLVKIYLEKSFLI